MKKVKVTETKSLDIKALRKELADFTMDLNMKKLKDVKLISKKKKELARALTTIRQKEMLAQLESKSRQSSVVSHQTEKEADEKQEKLKKANKRKEKSDS